MTATEEHPHPELPAIAGRVAYVTGASSGIGQACALALAAKGATVAVGYRTNRMGAEATLAKLSNGMLTQVDVSRRDEVERSFAEVRRHLGPVDILVNCAGITKDRLLIRLTETDWRQVLATNLDGPFFCTKAAISSMLERRWGRIINIGSIVGLEGNAAQSNYAAAKAGLIGLTRSVAKEVGRRGITANVIAPGFVETAITATIRPEVRDGLREIIWTGRSGLPSEIAMGAVFLAENGYVTGQVLRIDGGL
jgi:3-oxoacyl-[acyl-carrier protein] reductase